jgi:hypothetical protein
MFKNFSIVLLLSVLITGCGGGTASQEQEMTEANQKTLIAVQPPVRLSWSLEREQINKRTKLWNDPNKVSYIYLVSYGKVMAFYTIKGKVSSVNSQITNPEQKVTGSSGNITLPSPAEDGSYGENGDGIFFFTTDGTYVEWAGEYMLADKPLKMSTPPALVRNIN